MLNVWGSHAASCAPESRAATFSRSAPSASVGSRWPTSCGCGPRLKRRRARVRPSPIQRPPAGPPGVHQVDHHGLPQRRTQPHRHVRSQARGPGRISRRVPRSRPMCRACGSASCCHCRPRLPTTAIVRNMWFRQQGHTSPELYTGFLSGDRPAIGSVVSKLRADAGMRSSLPPYVYLGDGNHVGRPGFLGISHAAYQPGSQVANLGLVKGIDLDRLADRRVRCAFDMLRRDVEDARGSVAGVDAFTAQTRNDHQRPGPRRLRREQGTGPRAGKVRPGDRSPAGPGRPRRACRSSR